MPQGKSWKIPQGRSEGRPELFRGDNIKCFSREASVVYDNFVESFNNYYVR